VSRTIQGLGDVARSLLLNIRGELSFCGRRNRSCDGRGAIYTHCQRHRERAGTACSIVLEYQGIPITSLEVFTPPMCVVARMSCARPRVSPTVLEHASHKHREYAPHQWHITPTTSSNSCIDDGTRTRNDYGAFKQH
jgi:hypothetical protein